MFDDDDGMSALEMGTAYALLRHGQDRQTEQLLAGQNRPVEVHIHQDTEPDDDEPILINHRAFVKDEDVPASWDDYIGQVRLKTRLMTSIKAAKNRNERLPHVLLASGYPGVGKTTMARLIAQMMDVNMIELVPPFTVETVAKAAQQMKDGEIVFIDEIHKLASGGDILLKILEDGVAYVGGTAVKLPDVTYIGATTDKDRLLTTVLDRFKIKPHFAVYDSHELMRITIVFAFRHEADDKIDDTLAATIALACRSTPRIAEEFVLAAKDMADADNVIPTPEGLLEFMEVEPDGLTRTHIDYITAMFQYYGRVTKDGGREFICGEAAIMQMLRETPEGIGRIERFLIERGLIDRTPRGRKLTTNGIAKAIEFLAQGKGVADVA